MGEKVVNIRLLKARGDGYKNMVVFNSAGLNLTQILVRIIGNYSLKILNCKLL